MLSSSKTPALIVYDSVSRARKSFRERGVERETAREREKKDRKEWNIIYNIFLIPLGGGGGGGVEGC